MKKRGRKPKGGKLIDAPSNVDNQVGHIPPVVLHLRCRLSDLERPLVASQDPVPYEGPTDDPLPVFSNESPSTDDDAHAPPSIDDRLNELSLSMLQNEVSDRDSACFWCTFPFDNPPVYIPRLRTARSLKGYGCFCSPECATAYLFAEKNLDKSTMHERHCLLNNVYGSQYDEPKPIKAAPNPHFLLSRFCGNLSIEEYRESLASNRIVLVVNEPLSRMLPQIHVHAEGLCAAPSRTGQYRLARKHRPKTKAQRLNQAFGV